MFLPKKRGNHEHYVQKLAYKQHIFSKKNENEADYPKTILAFEGT
jgi:hypothetical protein